MGARKHIKAEERKAALKTQYFAKLKDVPSSPRKMRYVVDMIRGMEVNRALGALHFSTKHAARSLELVLKSAVANWETKTGKKPEQKKYYRVSGWIGGLKETKARDMMANRSDYAMEIAVKGMLPKNTLGKTALTRLHLYKGAEHPHAAQKPEAWTLD